MIASWLMLVAVGSAATAEPAYKQFIGNSCLDCHDGDSAKGDLNLEPLLDADLDAHLGKWETVLRRLGARQMPPPDKKRPSEADYETAVASLAGALDALAADNPRPGRTDTIRRLNRTEYQNAVRDLLDFEIDAADLLPPDASSHGFDNVTVGELSPTLLTRYLTAAQTISRLAVGRQQAPTGATIRVAPDKTQEGHQAGLPLGTRGGTVFTYNFPRDGEYEFRVHLTRDRNEMVEGLHGDHELQVLLDRELKHSFSVKPPKNRRDHTKVDDHLRVRMQVAAGPRAVGVTFVAKPPALIETKRQPYLSRFNHHRHPRQSPAVLQMSISGPFDAADVSETPSRRRIFTAYPGDELDAESAARRILSQLARRAYRRPVSDQELDRLLLFYRQGIADGGFEAGVQEGLSAILVSPQFLFRVERDPPDAEASQAYPLTDFELASRLSFFLWSSIPDEPLLAAAEAGRLHQPEELERQVRRLLANPKSASLIDNFAGQWLHLRNLDAISPNQRLFPDFDDNLRQAFRRETELFVADVWRRDRSLLKLLAADYTFVNERLAKHYGIPHVYGSRFRRVDLQPEQRRGGLLRHGSILTVTSYATRTSPVLRGNWILENVLGTPPPPPPNDVPSLDAKVVDQSLPMRQRLAQHVSQKSCATCHKLMDPIGFAWENYDAIGRWRTHDGNHPLDVDGGLPDGQAFAGIDGLEDGLLKRPELFVTTVTEKLMTFALGRGIEPQDGPAIRKIVADAAKDEYRFSAIVAGIAGSVPFTMRETP